MARSVRERERERERKEKKGKKKLDNVGETVEAFGRVSLCCVE